MPFHGSILRVHVKLVRGGMVLFDASRAFLARTARLEALGRPGWAESEGTSATCSPRPESLESTGVVPSSRSSGSLDWRPTVFGNGAKRSCNQVWSIPTVCRIESYRSYLYSRVHFGGLSCKCLVQRSEVYRLWRPRGNKDRTSSWMDGYLMLFDS